MSMNWLEGMGTGMAIGWPGFSIMSWSMPMPVPSSQFMLIRTFLSAGCSLVSLAAAAPPHIVRPAIGPGAAQVS